MVIRENQHPVETRERARGGEGLLTLHHLLTPEQLFHHGRLLSKSILQPGCSLGYHEHHGEMEFFYIISGTAEVFDGKQRYLLNPGDTMYTGDGEGHSIACHGDETMEYIALILFKE